MCNEAARRIALHQPREDWSQAALHFAEGTANMAPPGGFWITGATTAIGAGGGKPMRVFRSVGRDLQARPAVARCHTRQVVGRDNRGCWLAPAVPSARLCPPPPAGNLLVEPA